MGELSDVCSQIVFKCLYLSRVGGPDILWPVNKLARAITKWTRAFNKRPARLISHIHFTSEYKQYCHVGNTALQCRLGLFQDSDFAGDLEDSKSTSGGTLCIFGSHTFVPKCWMCKKQTCVSHSSTESEIISLDAGLRMDGIPALDVVSQVLHPNSNKIQKFKQSTGKPVTHSELSNVDSVSSNVISSHEGAMFFFLKKKNSWKTPKQWSRWLSNLEVPI